MPRDGQVVLEPHRSSWAAAFAAESARIASALSLPSLTLHHVGSTAVPGIAAKPILDVLAVASGLRELDERRANLERLGYEYKGEYGIPGRRYSVLYDEEAATSFVHLHAFAPGNPEVESHLLFRDYLRAHPAKAKEYESLKLALLNERLPRSQYTERKAPLIKQLLEEARAWKRPISL